MTGIPVTVELDRPRAIRWTHKAIARNQSLPRPVDLSRVSPKRAIYDLCAIVWAALVEADHDFAEPADLAEFFKATEQHVAALKAVNRMFEEALAEKKSEAEAARSANGRSPSSKVSAESPTTGT